MSSTETATERELERARECVTYDLGASIERVAQALADQRARYEAVADQLDDWQANLDDDPTWVSGYLDGIAAGTRRIRQVAR